MKKNLSLLAILLLINSCVEFVAVTSVVTGNLAIREKSLSDSKDDLVITSKIIKEFTLKGLKKPSGPIDVTVNEKRVLLTGITDNEDIAKRALDLCWKVKGVKEVIDEIQIAPKKDLLKSMTGYSIDAIITTKTELKMLLDKDISSSNYKVITVNKIIYLIGVAQDEDEIFRVTNLAAKIKGANKVISHVILKDDNRRS